MSKWFAWGQDRPENRGLSKKEIRALEDERVFPKSSIAKKGQIARRQGKEASARGFFSFGKKVMHSKEKERSQVWW